MKISTLLTASVVLAAQLASAMPTWNGDYDFDDGSEMIPTNGTDIDQGILIRGVGVLQAEHEAKLAKRDVGKKQVVGVKAGTNSANAGAVYRQEIRQLAKDQEGRVFTLYLMALQDMYRQTDANSFFELAGIHGRPYKGWDFHSSSTNNQRGYCTHGSTLFPTWHRPYLVYFEEALWDRARRIVNGAKDKVLWTRALNSLRIPYFDPASEPEFPTVFTLEKWKLTQHPDGRRDVIMSNPLFQGSLTQSKLGSLARGPWNYWVKTRRAPTSQDPNGGQDMNAVRDGVVQNYDSLRQRTLQLLLNNNSWQTFSNRGSSNGADSLEAIHDTCHGLYGRSGHMTYVEYSAFDPIFFLHHTNVDRLFAIWQAIHPNVWVANQVNGGGTYGQNPNTVEWEGSPLRPWRRTNNQWYNSNQVRSTNTFGYQYPETPKHRYPDAGSMQRYARQRAQALYGSPISARRKRDLGNATEAGIDASLHGNTYTDWKIVVNADKSAVNGTYSVHFFLGKPARNPEKWFSQPELVGTYVCFTHSEQAAPGIDPSLIDNNVTGAVPLTDAMVKSFPDTELNSLNPVDAIPFLVKNLRWRVTDAEGNAIKVRKVKGLKVSVEIATVSLPVPGREWSEWGPWSLLTEIARRIGKDGGPDKINVIPDLSSSSIVPSSASTSAATETATEVDTSTSAAVTEDAVEPTTTASEVAASSTSSVAETTSTDAPAPTETSS